MEPKKEATKEQIPVDRRIKTEKKIKMNRHLEEVTLTEKRGKTNNGPKS